MAHHCSIDLYLPLDQLTDGKSRPKIARCAPPEASFLSWHGREWVHPHAAGQHGLPAHIPPLRMFKHAFPWWAQVAFAGADKLCDAAGDNASPDAPPPRLRWALPLSKAIANLAEAMAICRRNGEKARTQGQNVQALAGMEDLHRWLSAALAILPEAIAVLDWAEVSLNSFSHASARDDNGPNEIMEGFRGKGGAGPETGVPGVPSWGSAFPRQEAAHEWEGGTDIPVCAQPVSSRGFARAQTRMSAPHSQRLGAQRSAGVSPASNGGQDARPPFKQPGSFSNLNRRTPPCCPN